MHDGEVSNGGPLADTGIEDLEEMDGVVLDAVLSGVDGSGDGAEVLCDGFASEAFMDGGGEIAHDGAGGCEADADGVFWVWVFGEMVDEFDFDIHDAEPPLGGVFNGSGVDDEVVESGGGAILEEKGGPFVVGEVVAEARDEGLVHLPAMECLACGDIADHGSAGTDDGCLVTSGGGAIGIDLLDDVLGLDKAPAGTDDDFQPLLAGSGDGLSIGLGDDSLRIEEGAIEVEGEEIEISDACGGHGSEDMRVWRLLAVGLGVVGFWSADGVM